MPDQTARDAVAGVIFKATFAVEWDDCQDGYQETRAMILRDAEAIMSALGIPPEMATSEISAALTLLDHMTATWTEGGPSRLNTNGAYVVNAAGRGWAYGASPAAAIHALNAKLAERADG